MKKILAMILAVVMLLTLVACGGASNSGDNSGTSTPQPTENSAGKGDTMQTPTETSDNAGSSAQESTGKKLSLLGYTVDDENKRTSLDIWYPENKDIVDDREYAPDATEYRRLVCEKDNWVLEICLYNDRNYSDNKEGCQENRQYKQFEINGKECFAFASEDGWYYEIHLLLDESEIWEEERYVVFSMDLNDTMADNKMDGEEFFENKDIKAIIESFVYNGVVDAPAE